MPEWLASSLLELDKYVSKLFGGEITDTVAQIARKKPTTFEEFARDHVAYFTTGT